MNEEGYPTSPPDREKDYMRCRLPDLPKTLRIRTQSLRDIFCMYNRSEWV